MGFPAEILGAGGELHPPGHWRARHPLALLLQCQRSQPHVCDVRRETSREEEVPLRAAGLEAHRHAQGRDGRPLAAARQPRGVRGRQQAQLRQAGRHREEVPGMVRAVGGGPPARAPSGSGIAVLRRHPHVAPAGVRHRGCRVRDVGHYYVALWLFKRGYGDSRKRAMGALP
jgi:hypothetical protein